MQSIIFGGEGFIGQHLTSALQSAGVGEVTSVDLISRGSGARFIEGDVRDGGLESRRDIVDSSASPPWVFNLAAVHRTPGHPDYEYFETNLRGAENVCAFAKKHRVRTLVFTSSIAPYGASEPLKTEESLPLPNTAYGISKLVAEHIHRTWQAERPDERRLVIVRPGVVFGRGEGGNMSRLSAALHKRRFVYPGRKDTLKACVYVKDVARLLVEMASKPEPGVFLFNLTYEPSPSIEEICTTMSRVTGAPLPRFVLPGGILRVVAAGLAPLQGLLGEGFHPDRVKKLMVSNNISGRRLIDHGYKLEYSLEEALRDWMNDCGQTVLI